MQTTQASWVELEAEARRRRAGKAAEAPRVAVFLGDPATAEDVRRQLRKAGFAPVSGFNRSDFWQILMTPPEPAALVVDADLMPQLACGRAVAKLAGVPIVLTGIARPRGEAPWARAPFVPTAAGSRAITGAVAAAMLAARRAGAVAARQA
jgi:hypothetical protein